MCPAHSSDMTQSGAAAPGQYASGPATQDMRPMPHLPRQEAPKDLIQPEDSKLEPVVRGNIRGLENKTIKKKPQTTPYGAHNCQKSVSRRFLQEVWINR